VLFSFYYVLICVIYFLPDTCKIQVCTKKYSIKFVIIIIIIIIIIIKNQMLFELKFHKTSFRPKLTKHLKGAKAWQEL